MGRAPCCDKANVKKGPWSPEEDAKLKAYIEQHGTGGNWIALPQKIGLRRCGKSCRLRWLNYLRPNIKHGGFSEEEDNIICSLYISIGSRWSIIAAQLPGRTDNDIKNYWNTRLKKKLVGMQRKEQQARRASCLIKQGMKRGSENFMAPAEAASQIPYWASSVLPVTTPEAHHQQENNNNSTNFQYSFDISSTQDQFYDHSVNMLASSASTNSTNSTCSQIPNTQYGFNGVGPNMFEELNNFPIDLDELLFGNPQGLISGLESFCGIDMGNGSTAGTSTSAESPSWGDVSSLVYAPMLSNYEACQQVMLQDSTFVDSSRFRSQ
ncbi:hypothetical protein L1049_023681 [Liquidambar formosana]|uniref:Uncharacterized protein n=1 Tax=Liquidambar formosana TaxID=63359 RepID=A0AAP0RZF9_LIQFO